ncbi:MAG: alpha/beta hydrolase [Candidatus Adiutrix sp.]|nr:alpha/beta hydrolase [Candidatus Adiutrix sp.]
MIVAVGVGLGFRDRLIFHPLAEEAATPAAYGINFEETWLTTAAGGRVRAWRLPAAPGASGRTALFFQGNSGNMSIRLGHLSSLQALGLNVLSVDYPGYGPSPGRPSETAVYQAAEALWNWAVQEGAQPEEMLIYGYSLGGGTAAWLAKTHPPAALVLDSTFTMLREVPAYDLPWLSPYLKLSLGEAFDTRSRLAAIQCPLLVFHSPDDEVVPFALGRELFESYPRAKDFGQTVGGHTDFLLNKPLFLEKMNKLLDSLPPRP